MKDDLNTPLLPEEGWRAAPGWWEIPLLPQEGCARRARGGRSRITTHKSRITICRSALLAALLTLAGCGPQPWVREGNYVTYDHPFTEASAQAVRKNAEGICRQRDLAAFESSRVCSLTQCTTSYQCMSAEDAKRLIGEKKK
jgi:hypothetical protein